MPALPTPLYAIATGLRGFASDSLRVLVVRAEGPNVWVRTADLRDAGTPLVLDASQVTLEEDLPSEGDAVHAAGLVVFGGAR